MNITFRHLDPIDSLKNYAQEKVARVNKYLDSATEAHVVLSLERHLHHADITIHSGTYVLRGREKSEDMYASIDQVVEKLESQVKRFKGKLIERSHQPRDEWPEGAIYESEEDEMPRIVRTKQFQLKPMPVEEAAMQMELLNHNFYVFLNSENEQVNVIYKRNDGNYALIVAEV